MFSGTINEEIIEVDEVDRFKKLFGNDLFSVIQTTVKFHYDSKSCGVCVRDLLLENMPLYINLATESTKVEMEEYLFEAFVDRKENISAKRHGSIIQCVKSLDCDVSSVPISLPRGISMFQVFGWSLNPVRQVFIASAVALSYDNKIFTYPFDRNALLKTIPETDGRIKADYSRILRYFRIYGRIATEKDVPDQKTLEIIKANISGLQNIKGEQLWTELKNILLLRMRGKLVKTFFKCGGFKYIGLPENPSFDEFENLLRHVALFKYQFLPITYLCAFLKSPDEVFLLHQKLLLSSYERDMALFLLHYKAETRNIDNLSFYQRMCLLPIRGNKNITKEYVLELLMYNGKVELFKKLKLWN